MPAIMPTIYGEDYEPLMARIEESRKQDGSLVAKVQLDDGMEHLAFIDDRRFNDNHDSLQAGDWVECMITGIVHGRRNGRIDRSTVAALKITEVRPYHKLLAIDGFAKGDPGKPATALGIESDGEIMTQGSVNHSMEMHSLRPLSASAGTKRTKVVTPGRTGAYCARNASLAFRNNQVDERVPTNVWITKADLKSKTKRPFGIQGLTRIEDLDLFDVIQGRPAKHMRKAA